MKRAFKLTLREAAAILTDEVGHRYLPNGDYRAETFFRHDHVLIEYEIEADKPPPTEAI